jgi:hypothetical protein
MNSKAGWAVLGKHKKKKMKSFKPRHTLDIKELATYLAESKSSGTFCATEIADPIFHAYYEGWKEEPTTTWEMCLGQVKHTLDFLEYKGYICYVPNELYTTIDTFKQIKTEILIQQNETNT